MRRSADLLPLPPSGGEGGAPQAQDSRRAPSPQPSSPKRGEGAGCDSWLGRCVTPSLSPNEIPVSGVTLIADLAGALYWPEERLLVVSDLHLEKGSSLATRGVLLPPYDTAATLERLAGTLSRHNGRLVIALGDNFHDPGGPTRLTSADRARLSALQRGRDWIWIAGNHDPAPADHIGGTFANAVALGPLVFRHEPTPDPCHGEIAGHLHPVARISRRGHTLRRRCFATDGTRLVMPAFGAYTGGLNIRHAAFAQIFGARDFTAHLLGQRRLYAFAAARCLGDGGPATTLSGRAGTGALQIRESVTGPTVNGR